MNGHIQIEVIDRDGWRKAYTLQKNIIHIGSNPRSDLVLAPERGGGVAGLHAQLLVSTGGSGSQLINLSGSDILLGPSGDTALSPRSATGITNGMVFRLGDFTLTFQGDEEMVGKVAGSSKSSASASTHIGLEVSLPKMRLAADQSLDGTVTVSNLGDQSGVQFDLEVEGLEADCYSIEPGPLLSSGAEREVSFHLHHLGNRPLAGDHRITIRATAPQVYPDEQAVVSRVIQVLPTYRHTLQIVPPSSEAAGKELPDSKADAAIPPPPVPAPSSPEQREDGPPPADQVPEQDWWTDSSQAGTGESEPPVEQVSTEVVMQEEKAEEVAEQVADPEASPAAEVQEPLSPGGDEPQEVAVAVSLQAVEIPVPKTEAEPPLVEEQAAVAATGDQQAEASALADTPAEVDSAPQIETVLPVEAAPAQVEKEEEQAPEAEPSQPPSTEEWWAPEATISPQDQAREPQVLKLRASPPPDVAEQPAGSEVSPPPAAEDWWSAEVDAGPEESEEPQVLRLKASPSPETEAGQAQVEVAVASSTEDWWSDGQQVDGQLVGGEESEQAEEQET